MPWQVEQNTGVNNTVIRFEWFNGYIHAFTENAGIWRRDGVGPWTQVFTPSGGNRGGTAWVWGDDAAVYCSGGGAPGPGGNRVYRSEDGVNWAQDVDLNATFGLQASYNPWSVIGGYGSYLYLANYDVTTTDTYFYRRDLAGNWATFGAPYTGAEGAGNRGIVGFGTKVYWTNATSARYWDGAAWALEPTLHAQDGTWMSVLNGLLYVRTSTTATLVGGYYWKTPASTEWAFLNLPVPDNTWGGWPLCQGADGEIYTVAQDGTTLRIYQKVGDVLDLLYYQDTVAAGLGTRGGICVDAAGDMYFGTNPAAAIRFFAYVPDYDMTPVGNGLIPQSLDVDGDGNRIYVCCYDTATGAPVLIRAELPLAAGSVGSVMFPQPPGAGTSINVKATAIGGRLVVSGDFGANEQVEISEDAALNWTDVDPGTWGAEVAQPLLADSTDEITVALAGAQDFVETFDQGALWLTRNPAIGYSPGAAARLPHGDEVVLGDDAANRIDYSPNRGAELHDITGTFVGNIAALEVV